MTLSEEIEAAREFVANAAKWNDRGDPRAAKAGLCLAETALAQAATLAAQPPPGSSVALREALGVKCGTCGRPEADGVNQGGDTSAFCWRRLLKEGGSTLVDERCEAARQPYDAEALAHALKMAEDNGYRGCSNCGGWPHSPMCSVALAAERHGHALTTRLAAAPEEQEAPRAACGEEVASFGYESICDEPMPCPRHPQPPAALAAPQPLPSAPREAEVTAEANEINHLRKLLALRHGCSAASLYRDDGELQCPTCHIDFVRDAPEVIEARWIRINKDKMTEPLPSAKPQEEVCFRCDGTGQINQDEEDGPDDCINCDGKRHPSLFEKPVTPATAGHNPEGVEAREALPSWDGTRPMVQPELGKRVRAARLDAQMSLRYAAAALHMTAVQLGGIERGVYECPDFARMLCFFAIKTQLSAENAAHPAEDKPPAGPSAAPLTRAAQEETK